MENKQAQELNIMEVVLKAVRTAVAGTAIVENKGTTGTSFFEGKKRLCKILFTKKGLSLEVNVKLSAALEKKHTLEPISKAQAHKKHLGTMVYMVRQSNLEPKDVPAFVKAMVEQFNKEKEQQAQAQ